MTKKKIAIIVTVAVLVLAIGVAGTFIFLSAADKEKDDDRKKDESTTLASGGDITAPDGSSQGGAQDNSIASQLLGKWRDGANMSGYEFKADGTVVLTYIDLGFTGLDIFKGDVDGVYTLEGDKLTISTSIYSGTISNSYTASVSGNVLTLVSTEDGDVSTYMRSEDTDTDVGADVTEPSKPQTERPDGTDLAGTWSSDDGDVKYAFNSDGTVDFKKNGNEYSGVYIIDDDKVSIQYTSGDNRVTERFEYRISGNILSLENIDGRYVLTRNGTAPSVGSSDELIGKWSDGAGMSGYEFKDGGIVEFTYVNLDKFGIDLPVGTYPAAYTVDGNTITISFSVYGATISDSYTYEVSGNTLKMTAADGSVSTYIKQ